MELAIGQFGSSLEDVLKRTGDTRLQAATSIKIDNSTLGKIMKGTRKAHGDVMSSAAKHYDDGQLFIAAASEVTGGAFPPWLNNVDLHRASVLIKTAEELKEVLAAGATVPISKTNEQISEVERRQIKQLIMETLEAITALTHLAAVLCREYSFSWLETWKEHRADLKAKQYMK